MGQEASLPSDPEAVEEQGRVAPLQSSSTTRGGGGGMGSSSHHRTSHKLMKFRSSNNHNTTSTTTSSSTPNQNQSATNGPANNGSKEHQAVPRSSDGASSPPPPPPPPPSITYSEPPQWTQLDSQQQQQEDANNHYQSTQPQQHYAQPPQFDETIIDEHQSFADAALQFGPPQPLMNNTNDSSYNNSNAAAAIYEHDNNHYAPAQPTTTQMASSSTTTTPSKRSGGGGVLLAGRASARGAALIQGMRNLNISSKFGGSTSHGKSSSLQQQQQSTGSAKATPGKKPEADWEKQWDADDDEEDDDDDGEEEVEQAGQGVAQVDRSIPSSAPLPLQQQQQQQQQQHIMQQHQASIPTGYAATSSSSSSPPRIQLPQQQQTPVVVQDLLDTDMLDVIGTDKPDLDMFSMLRVLGKGSFGKVILVQKQQGKECGHLFAMKVLRKTHLVKRRQIERTRTERKVLSAVNHPFIMKLHYAFQSESKLYLVLDYCPGGELFFHLSRFRRFPERVARFFSAELLLAIGHLHKRSIIYRDLKPENVLMDAEGHVKLGDFGLSKTGIIHPCEGAHSMCGTPEYMSPEILAQQGHGFCVDYWGLGMLTYEMMTGLPPWYTTDRAKLFRRLKSAPLEVPSYFSTQASDCISGLLERNPHRRLGVAGIRSAMEHDFYRSINWRALYARRIESPIKPCEGWKPPEGDFDVLGSGAASPVLDHNELEAATANFDNTFTRMPVVSEDHPNADEVDDAEEELNEQTFLGFSFDGGKELFGIHAETKSSQQQPPESRQRTHHLQAPQALG